MLNMFVIYDHPTDFPDFFVMRRWFTDGRSTDPQPTEEVHLATDLETLRDHVKGMGLTRIVRDPTDDKKVVETWL